MNKKYILLFEVVLLLVSCKSIQLTKMQLINEYFSLFQTIDRIDSQNAISDFKKIDNNIKREARKILSGKALDEFNNWWNIDIFMTQMIDPEIVSRKNAIIEDTIIDNNIAVLTIISKRYENDNNIKNILELIQKKGKDTELLINELHENAYNNDKGKYFIVFNTSERYTFRFENNKICEINIDIIDAEINE